MEQTPLAEAAVRRLVSVAPEPLPSLCSMKRAAFELSVSPSELKLMIRRGEIARTRKKVGGRYKIPASEILCLLETESAPAKRERAPKKTGTLGQRIRALTQG